MSLCRHLTPRPSVDAVFVGHLLFPWRIGARLICSGQESCIPRYVIIIIVVIIIIIIVVVSVVVVVVVVVVPRFVELMTSSLCCRFPCVCAETN